MDNKYTITVSVDSSFKDGKAACAYYIKHECFVVKDTEYLGEITTSVLAEFEGIKRAVNRMIDEIRSRTIKLCYITCDCIPALDLFRDYLKSGNYPMSFTLQHIDAHSGINSPR